MARALTAPEVAIYRTPHYATRVLFAIPEYHVIYSAELDDVPDTNDQVGSITYVNGVGTLGNVKADMTMYVGTSAGAYDLGMCRIRKAPVAGTFYIGEISEVEFDYGGTIYLTVVDDYSLWAKPVKLVDGVAKMDYDIDYSDQHTNFDPVPVLGSHAVGKLVNGTVTLQLGPSDDTASYVIDSAVASYTWSCVGASFSSTTVANPNVTFTNVGTYLAYCTITGTNGKTFQGVRYVIIYDDDHPLYSGTLKSWSYDYEAGGLSFSVEMYVGASEAAIRRRSLVIVVTEDTVDNQPVEFACPIDGRENILSVGWIFTENVVYHEQTGMVEFTCHNAANWLKNVEGYLSGVEFKVGTSDDWTNMSELTTQKMLHHILHWRTTATRIMDVLLTNDTRYAVGFKTITGGLWEQLAQIADASIFARPGVDRFNRLYIEIEQQMVPEANRSSFPEIMDIDNQDWIEGVRVQEELSRISMLYFSGVAVDASANLLAYVSLSPGHIHGHYGHSEVIDNYLVSDQANSNQLCGLYYGWQNNLKEFELEMAYSHRMMDIFPRQYVNLTITVDEDPRGIGYSGRAILRRIEGKHDAEDGVLSFTHFYEPETFEELAIDGDIPDSESENYGEIPHFPPYKPIPLTPTTLPVIPGDTPTDIAPRVVVIGTSNFGVLYTVNGDASNPLDIVWQTMNTGLTASLYNNIVRIIKTPSGALFALIVDSGDATGVGGKWVYWTAGVGGEWALLKDLTGHSGTSPRLIAIGVNPDANEEIAIATGTNNPAESLGIFYTGDRDGVTALATGLDADYRLGDISYGMGKWYMTHSESNIFDDQAFSRITAAGSIEKNAVNYALGQTYAASKHLHKRAGGIIYEWNHDGRYLRKIEDNNGDASNTTQPDIGVVEHALPNLLAIDPTGQYLMGGHDAAVGKKSSNGGTSWTNLSGIGIGYQVWECAGNASRFMAGSVQSVLWTNDFGTTWANMNGNLSAIASLCAITHIVYVSD